MGRKEAQKHLRADIRKYFKRSGSLLIQRYDTLEPEQKQAVNTMLWYSDEMCEAHSMKEWFFKVLDTKDISEMKQGFKNWLNSVDTTD